MIIYYINFLSKDLTVARTTNDAGTNAQAHTGTNAQAHTGTHADALEVKVWDHHM